MAKKVSKKSKRRLVIISLAMIACVFVIVSSVLKNLLMVMNNKKQISSLTKEYNSLLKEEKKLEAEVTKLQDPDYVARYARETFFYSLPGEVIIKMK